MPPGIVPVPTLGPAVLGPYTPPHRPAAARQAREKTAAPPALKAALKAQLALILEKDIDPKMLFELEQFAGISQQLLIVAGDPRAVPLNAGRRGMGLGGGYGMGMTALAPQDLGDDLLDSPMPALGGMAENFGAASIRQLMESAKAPGAPGLYDLMKSLESAKEQGDMPDIVAELEVQIKAQVLLDKVPEKPEGIESEADIEAALIAVGVDDPELPTVSAPTEPETNTGLDESLYP
jgi:hypothetical protein